MLYPNDDLVLPSLWEALTGRQDVDWAEREDGGRFVDFTPDFARVWRWKDGRREPAAPPRVLPATTNAADALATR